MGKFKWFILNFGLVILSGLAGLSGYVYNLLISNIWGALTLGKILGVIGVFSVFVLPATLMVLPVAKWSIQTKDWKQKLPMYQFYSFLLGVLIVAVFVMAKGLWGRWIDIPNEWLIPLVVFTIPVFLFYFQMGVFMGRRSYWWMGIVGTLPHIGKPLMLSIGFFSETLFQDPVTALWITAISKWIATIVGLIGMYSISSPKETVELPSSLWASGWTSVTTNSWMTFDSAIAYVILSSTGLSIYGVIATLGKIPFYLASNVANTGINEKIWGNSNKYGTQILIVGIGVLSILGFLVLGEFFMKLFGVEDGLFSLILYMIGTTILSLIYYQVGIDAQKGLHTWYPMAIILVLWMVWAFLTKPNYTEFIISICVSLILSLIACTLVKKVHFLSFAKKNI